MYTFIVNPNARSGLGQLVWDELEETLKKEQVAYQVHFTKYQKHATKLVAEITSDHEPHTIVALGGDGTINEVVNGIQNFRTTTLGYIPIGSGNDFARGMKISKDPQVALRAILDAKRTEKIDVACLEYGKKAKRFAVSCDYGFTASVTHEVVISRLKVLLNKLKLGKLTYAAVAVRRLFLFEPKPMSITLDGKQTLHFQNAYFVGLMNNPYSGGGVKFCPKAKIDDGILDAIVVSNVSKPKILFVIPLAFFGLHVHFKGVHTYRCKEILITSDHAHPAHTDGEPIFLQRTLKASILPEKLRILKN